MEQMTKIKWITISCIAIFLFMVAAFYTNTKDITNKQNQTQNIQQLEQNNPKPIVLNEKESESMVNTQRVEELSEQVRDLNSRIDNMSSNTQNAQCKIRGVIVDGEVQDMSPESAISEARDNGRELVLFCKI